MLNAYRVLDLSDRTGWLAGRLPVRDDPECVGHAQHAAAGGRKRLAPVRAERSTVWASSPESALA